MNHGFWDAHVGVAAYYDWQERHCENGRDLYHWDRGIRQLTKRWEAEFPKLSELHERSPDGAYDGWFENLPSRAMETDSSATPVPYFRKLESELARLSDSAWASLTTQILQNTDDGNQQLISYVEEATGW